jgi:integrase
VPAVKLTAAQITKWRDHMVETPPRLRVAKGQDPKFKATTDPRARRVTVNRTFMMLKAALRMAYEAGRIPTDDAWRRVRPFKNVSVARMRILTADETVRFLNACRPDFRDLARAAILTGMRYGELGRLVVEDFNPDTGILQVRETKTNKGRHVVLDDEARQFFGRVVLNRAPGDLMLTREGGLAWGPANQQDPMKAACLAANIAPLGFHQLRHSRASELIQGGVPITVAAVQLGHSAAMLEKNYLHFDPNFVADAVRGRAHRPAGAAEPDNVAVLHPKRAQR